MVVCLAHSMFPRAGLDYGISGELSGTADGCVVLGAVLSEIAQ